MKRKLKSLFGLLVLAALLIFTLEAQAQYQPNFYSEILTNGTTVITNGQTLDVSAVTKPITIRQGKGLAILPYFVATNASTANVVLNFNVSADGVNFTTTAPISITNALNGTTAVRGYALLTPLVLDNVRALQLSTIVNAHTNSISVSNVVASYSNQ